MSTVPPRLSLCLTYNSISYTSFLYPLSIFHNSIQLVKLCCNVPFQPSEIEMESQVHLYGHTAEITSLLVCKPYSIMISVSKDGTCIIWDLNRYKYI